MIHRLSGSYKVWGLTALLSLAGYALLSSGSNPPIPPYTGGLGGVSPSLKARTAPPAPVAVSVRQARLLQPAQPCTDTFVAHRLDHTTTATFDGGSPHMFESNGAGLAVNDLDGDGDLDVVLANLAGPDAILWNQGGLRFRTQKLPQEGSRDVSIVDVDGDGGQDIVFTQHTLAPAYWRNVGGGRFAEHALPGVDLKAYTMTWGDLDGDGDLDAVAGSYDTALEKDLGYGFMYTRSGGGVYYYENEGGAGYTPYQLAGRSDALAIALPDLNEDGRLDILVGNDFDTPDYAWQRQGAGWMEASPFATTTHSTMSLDEGDIDNDGRPEIFATDMKPYDNDIRTLAKWRPVMARMPHQSFRGDSQIMENVLQVPDGRGRFRNQAYKRSLDATGWSWSGKFGDLNNDGYLDLYVVNGMLAADLLDYLPGNELVERNQAFRNDGKGGFARAPGWGLGSTASGRGMSMADLDGDGDLDVVVNNLERPAELFENRMCGGSSLEVDIQEGLVPAAYRTTATPSTPRKQGAIERALPPDQTLHRWPRSKNTRAIGARLVLRASTGTYYRDVRASSGYLSGDPARVHFGFPAGARLRQLEVRWPDGKVSTVESPKPRTLLEVTR